MPKRHTPLDIERGLTALAVTGVSLDAARMTGYPDRTIRGWQAKHPDMWQRIKSQRAQLIDEACFEEFRTLRMKATHTAIAAVDATAEQLQEGTVRDPAGAARNLATTAGIMQDKINIAEGKPTSIVQHRTSEDVLRDLEKRGFVESTADEIGELAA